MLSLVERLRVKREHLMTNFEVSLLNELVESRHGVEFDLLTNCSLPNDELQSLLRKYRFVWIVENQSCKNHPNNHLFLTLETPSTIPILNAEPSGNLPHNSFIGLNKFGNVSNLVSHLQKLKLDFAKFYSHLQWKRYLKVSSCSNQKHLQPN